MKEGTGEPWEVVEQGRDRGDTDERQEEARGLVRTRARGQENKSRGESLGTEEEQAIPRPLLRGQVDDGLSQSWSGF